MITKFTKKRGYSLVEAIIYISILSLFFIVTINSMLSFTTSYREILALRLIERSGLDSMERITREIKAASSVDIVNSTLGSNPGVLTLISTYNTNSTTTKFYIQNNVLNVDINGVLEGPLSNASTSITNLIFHYISGGLSSAVKIDMTIQTSVGSSTKTKTYHSTVIIKGT